MPMPALMTVFGSSQGLISAGALSKESVGQAYIPKHQDKILVHAISHLIVAPGHEGSGRRMHKPLVITKTVDKSSPLLNTAMCNNELLEGCRLELYRPTTSAAYELFYTITLDDAIIVGIDLVMPHYQNAANASLSQFERVHFAYKCITWKHESGHTIGMDDWQGGYPA